MNNGKETELGNSLLAILAGAAATFLTGLILFPLLQLAFDQFWDLFKEKKGITGNDILLYVSIMSWLFIAALAGGFTCSLICKSYEKSHAFILIVIYLALLLINLSGKEKEDIPFVFISLIIVAAGVLLGTRTAVRMKKRRKSKENSAV